VTVAAITTAAGSLNGNVTLDLTSLAKAGSSLTDSSLTAGSLTVTGAVYDYAKPTFADGAILAFGNAHVGDVLATQTASVTNTVVTNAAFQDALRVVANAVNGKLTATGLASLTAGNSGNVTVDASTATAGSLAGDLDLLLTSLAKSGTGLTDSSLTAGKLTTTGAVYDYAKPTYVATALDFGNVRAGTTLAGQSIAINNLVVTDAAYQEALAVSASSANAKLALGSLAGLTAGNAAGTITVDASAATAGSLAGNISLGFTSLAKAGTNLGDTVLAGGTVAVTGAVYDYAKPTVVNSLAFGNVRVGAANNVAVANTTVTNAAFQDGLDVVASSSNGNLTVVSPAKIVAGQSGNVGVTATAVGDLAATITLNLTSNANGIAGLNDQALTAKTVAVTGTAYEYASAGLSSKTIAFGQLHVGATAVSDTVAVANTLVAAGYQDNLSVTANAVAGVTTSSISELAAGGSANLTFTADTSVARSLTGAVTLNLTSTSTVSGLDAKSLTTGATIATTGLVYSGQSVWATNGNGSWGTFASGFGANWGANQGSAGLDAAFADVDTATFDNTGLTAGTSATVTLDGAAPSLKSLAFNTTGGGFTLATGTGGALTFKSNTGTASLTSTAGTHTVTTAAALASNLAVAVSANSLALNGVLSGAGSLSKSGNGLLTLGGANTFTGGATVTGGKLALGHASALGSAAATVNGGELDLGGFTVANAVTLTTGTLSNGTLSNTTLAVAAGTVSANLAGSTAVTKTGAGTATLAVANTYAGATAVNGGTLAIGNAAALGTSTVTVATGATLDLAGLDVTGATLLLNGGAIANATAYSGSVGFAAGITSFGAADLTSLAANVEVRVAAGQTLNTTGLTRGIDFRGGSLANLGSYAGVLDVRGDLDATATGLSTGAINLTSAGNITLGNTASAAAINYQGGSLSGANFTGDLNIVGAVTVAGVVSAGTFKVDAGDTLTLGVNGVSANIKLLGGTVDFGGRTSTSSVAYSSGTIANGANFTGDVSYVGSLNLAKDAFGAGQILVAAGNTANFGAGFANRVSYSGGTIQNGANYAGTLTVNSGATLDAATNLAGSIVLNTGAQLAGVGSVGAVTAKDGSQISTGTSTPGLLTTAGLRLEAGSTLVVNMKDATAARGVGFDSVTVAGLLDLSALSAASRVTLQLKSLDANGLTGNLAVQSFAWNDPKSFTLFSYGTLNLGAGVSISDVFSIDYSGFKDENGNVARADWFTISNDTGAGAIVLTAIPEPSTYGLAIGALALAAAALRRRRKQKAADASAQ
jgi:fibronectin-binding autotransporter adhesin